MVMRVDETGNDQALGCVDRLVHAPIMELGQFVVAFDRFRETAADRRDHAIDDQDIGPRRLVDVAVMIVNTAVLDHHDTLGNLVRRHWRSGCGFGDAGAGSAVN